MKLIIPLLSHYANNADLLTGFFSYYTAFDFSSDVVCPYLGRPVSRESLLEPGAVEELRRMHENVAELDLPQIRAEKNKAACCVQDPFELNRNVTMNIHEGALTGFK